MSILITAHYQIDRPSENGKLLGELDLALRFLNDSGHFNLAYWKENENALLVNADEIEIAVSVPTLQGFTPNFFRACPVRLKY